MCLSYGRYCDQSVHLEEAYVAQYDMSTTLNMLTLYNYSKVNMSGWYLENLQFDVYKYIILFYDYCYYHSCAKHIQT